MLVVHTLQAGHHPQQRHTIRKLPLNVGCSDTSPSLFADTCPTQLAKIAMVLRPLAARSPPTLANEREGS